MLFENRSHCGAMKLCITTVNARRDSQGVTRLGTNIKKLYFLYFYRMLFFIVQIEIHIEYQLYNTEVSPMATPHTPSEAFTPTPSPAPTPTTETQPATQIPTTATLNTLPDEILELITSNIYHSALPTVILTSRKFHRIGTPILYRAIEYTDGRKQALYGLPKPWDKISGSPKQRTYIQDIGCLIRTIKKCEALRDMIVCVLLQSMHRSVSHE